MRAVMMREIRNYLKRPLFWAGVVLVIFGVFWEVAPYLNILRMASGQAGEWSGQALSEEAEDPDYVYDGDVLEGYVPTDEGQRREIWEEQIRETLVAEFSMTREEAEAVIGEMENLEIKDACDYLKTQYGYYNAIYAYEDAGYHQGTEAEFQAYVESRLEDHRFSFYFSRKFADFAGLYMGFFATVLLSVLFWQDTKKATYELLHTKPVSAAGYVLGKAAGGFAVCFLVLAVLNLVFGGLCLAVSRSAGYEMNFLDFPGATVRYILPNMLMIVSVYALISLLFQNPLPAAPLLILYMVYSNMGKRNEEGVFGYYGRPLAIMVRFPGRFFETVEPPMLMLNQCFLLIASFGILTACVALWRRRRV